MDNDDPDFAASAFDTGPLHDPEFHLETAKAGPKREARWRGHSFHGGIVLPIICLVADPIVFKGLDDGMLGQFRLFSYTLIGLEMLTMALWLALGERFGRGCGVIAGVLLAGALYALVLGVVLLPLSLMGLLTLIGALGLTPFFTTIVFSFQARRATRSAAARMRPAARIASILVGIALAYGLPGAVHWAWQSTGNHLSGSS